MKDRKGFPLVKEEECSQDKGHDYQSFSWSGRRDSVGYVCVCVIRLHAQVAGPDDVH